MSTILNDMRSLQASSFVVRCFCFPFSLHVLSRRTNIGRTHVLTQCAWILSFNQPERGICAQLCARILNHAKTARYQFVWPESRWIGRRLPCAFFTVPQLQLQHTANVARSVGFVWLPGLSSVVRICWFRFDESVLCVCVFQCARSNGAFLCICH